MLPRGHTARILMAACLGCAALPAQVAIAGRVVDEDGDPLAHVHIQALRYAYQDGRRQLVPQKFAETDDQGYYRIPGLTVGRYQVSAVYSDPHLADPDFSASMQVIGDTIAKRLQNLCVVPKLVDTKPDPGVQPDCRVVYRTPKPDPADPTMVIYDESPASLPQCDPSYSLTNPPPDSVGDCWKLDNDPSKCPMSYNNQVVTVLRTHPA